MTDLTRHQLQELAVALYYVRDPDLHTEALTRNHIELVEAAALDDLIVAANHGGYSADDVAAVRAELNHGDLAGWLDAARSELQALDLPAPVNPTPNPPTAGL
jgi:hypothetical protein